MGAEGPDLPRHLRPSRLWPTIYRVPVTLRSLRAVSLAGVAMVLLHVVQVAVFGHDLVAVLDGHGLDLLPGVLLTPSPALLLATLTLAFGLALLVVMFARTVGAAPRSQPAEAAGLVGPPPGVPVAAQVLGALAFGRAPPSLLI